MKRQEIVKDFLETDEWRYYVEDGEVIHACLSISGIINTYSQIKCYALAHSGSVVV